MRKFLTPRRLVPPQPGNYDGTSESSVHPSPIHTPTSNSSPPPADIFTGYLSDISDDEMLEDNSNINHDDSESDVEQEYNSPLTPQFRINQPPPLKRRRLDVSYQKARQDARKARCLLLQQGLVDIEKLIGSKKTKFETGREGLQARRARAIQSYLFMVVKNGRRGFDASERAAEAQGFARKWGARLVRRWVREWLKSHTLPCSSRGHHVKSFSLLEDPVIRAELHSFVRSNKWAMNPAKIVEFTQQRMIPEAAKKYLRQVVNHEMPKGLQQYIELDLFPRIQHKVSKSISLKAAQHFLHMEGFRYTEHKKALFYDGHERPDVVAMRQNEFIPQMEVYRPRLVEYQPDNLNEEVVKIPTNFVERRLVLVPQDEMTAQANDGVKKSWVLEGEQPLKKKGAGRGIHQSDVICATHGWMKEASQSLQYGKNYDGYWNGELFVKQVRI